MNPGTTLIDVRRAWIVRDHYTADDHAVESVWYQMIHISPDWLHCPLFVEPLLQGLLRT